MLAKDLLEILVCPKCKGDLNYHPEQSALDCRSCNLRYRIEDDIPVMLIDEATPIPAGASAVR
jgi:uncharacterized protein YbaR (Trm112 family)